jgi:hypothetical protein
MQSSRRTFTLALLNIQSCASCGARDLHFQNKTADSSLVLASGSGRLGMTRQRRISTERFRFSLVPAAGSFGMTRQRRIATERFRF